MELNQKIQIAKILAKDQVYKVQEKWQTSKSGKNSLTKDPAYNAANPKHFIPMMDEDRYSDRSDAFDKIISATHKHFWDPNDKNTLILIFHLTQKMKILLTLMGLSGLNYKFQVSERSCQSIN